MLDKSVFMNELQARVKEAILMVFHNPPVLRISDKQIYAERAWWKYQFPLPKEELVRRFQEELDRLCVKGVTFEIKEGFLRGTAVRSYCLTVNLETGTIDSVATAHSE